MVNVDISLLFQIINFLFLIWLLNTVLYKKIRGVVIARKERKESLLSTISSADTKVQTIEKNIESDIRKARAEGVKAKDAETNRALEEEKKIISEINERSKKELKDIKNRIVKEVATVKVSLQKEVDIFASKICEKVLGRAV